MNFSPKNNAPSRRASCPTHGSRSFSSKGATEGEPDNMGSSQLNGKSGAEGTPLNGGKKNKQNYKTIMTPRCIHGKEDCECDQKDTVASYQSWSDSGSDHCHVALEASSTNASAKRKLIVASILCLGFMIVECVGGYLASSLAIATDAAHLLTDFASFMISLFAIWISQRPASKRMSFGWHRAEVIGALTSVLLIWVVTGILVFIAIERVLYKEYEIDSTVMLATAGVGVVVNIIMGCALHHGGLPHGHSHGGQGHADHVEEGHGHGHGLDHVHDANANINVRAALIHVIGDFLQSLGVLVAALVIYFFPHLKIVDPICTFAFSIIVLFTTITILRETIMVLMEGKPKGIDFHEVRELLTTISGVKHVHNLRIWALTMEKTVLSTHVGIEAGSSDYHRIQKECVRLLRAKYAFHEVTVQVEEWNPNMIDCSKCNDIPLN
ncbi:zinc transporter 2 isoform X2 [Galendromus occidentalis]|uniref:Zinc transporter 2 isoform X2 n=1 Tax=Galendromus occidentalis TaxID=34638 RepID=A0AAJ6QP70_9ACAR|nr:zinc transporter 2 isoform X2 [Galendromus occidentalis]